MHPTENGVHISVTQHDSSHTSNTKHLLSLWIQLAFRPASDWIKMKGGPIQRDVNSEGMGPKKQKDHHQASMPLRGVGVDM